MGVQARRDLPETCRRDQPRLLRLQKLPLGASGLVGWLRPRVHGPQLLTLWLGANDAVLVDGSKPKQHVPLVEYEQNLKGAGENGAGRCPQLMPDALPYHLPKHDEIDAEDVAASFQAYANQDDGERRNRI
eukprot:jgi/Pico_ML_1/50636/g165.t1